MRGQPARRPARRTRRSVIGRGQLADAAEAAPRDRPAERPQRGAASPVRPDGAGQGVGDAGVGDVGVGVGGVEGDVVLDQRVDQRGP